MRKLLPESISSIRFTQAVIGAMTIAYQADVSTSTLLGFWKLVARWRGSVYKLIYKEMLVYGAAFTAIAIWYRRFMTADQRRLFEQLALYSDRALEHIPLSFVLGFYVSFVAGRWWDQFTSIPWPDRLAHVVLAYVSGGDEQGRLLRRTMMRYANLGLVLVLKSVSGCGAVCDQTHTHDGAFTLVTVTRRG